MGGEIANDKNVKNDPRITCCIWNNQKYKI